MDSKTVLLRTQGQIQVYKNGREGKHGLTMKKKGFEGKGK